MKGQRRLVVIVSRTKEGKKERGIHPPRETSFCRFINLFSWKGECPFTTFVLDTTQEIKSENVV